MASDEAVQLSLDYLNSKRVHDKLVNAINDNNISEILDLVQDGYTQGRADALRWIPVSESLPERYEYVLCRQKDGEIHMLMLCANSWDGYGDKCESIDLVSHWLPITLPTEAK